MERKHNSFPLEGEGWDGGNQAINSSKKVRTSSKQGVLVIKKAAPVVKFVIPAKAGIQELFHKMPAYTGMTGCFYT